MNIRTAIAAPLIASLMLVGAPAHADEGEGDVPHIPSPTHVHDDFTTPGDAPEAYCLEVTANALAAEQVVAEGLRGDLAFMRGVERALELENSTLRADLRSAERRAERRLHTIKALRAKLRAAQR